MPFPWDIEEEVITRPLATPTTTLGGIRERAIQNTLDRLARVERDALRVLDPGQTGLSPYLKKNSEFFAKLSEQRRLLRDDLGVVKQQNAAERARSKMLLELSPLKRARLVGSFLHRSDRDRNAAIAGMIERGRKDSVASSREVYSRVKATAAARRWMKFLRGVDNVPGFDWEPRRNRPGKLDRIFYHTFRKFDPCVDRAVRREVLIAKRLNKGHRARKRYKYYSFAPC